jgi:hypothetical protein
MRIRKIASFSHFWLDHGAQPPRTPQPRLKPLRAQPSPPLPRLAGAFIMSRNFGDPLAMLISLHPETSSWLQLRLLGQRYE